MLKNCKRTQNIVLACEKIVISCQKLLSHANKKFNRMQKIVITRKKNCIRTQKKL